MIHRRERKGRREEKETVFCFSLRVRKIKNSLPFGKKNNSIAPPPRWNTLWIPPGMQADERFSFAVISRQTKKVILCALCALR